MHHMHGSHGTPPGHSQELVLMLELHGSHTAQVARQLQWRRLQVQDARAVCFRTA